MKNRHLILTVICALLALSPITGAAKKKPTPAPIQPTTISSVAGNSITISQGQTSKTLVLTQFTEIMVNGQRATVADLKPGMAVNVTLGTDPSKVSRINATGK